MINYARTSLCGLFGRSELKFLAHLPNIQITHLLFIFYPVIYKWLIVDVSLNRRGANSSYRMCFLFEKNLHMFFTTKFSSYFFFLYLYFGGKINILINADICVRHILSLSQNFKYSKNAW